MRFRSAVAIGTSLALLGAAASCSSFGEEEPSTSDASTDVASTPVDGASGDGGPLGPDGGSSDDGAVRRLAVFVTVTTTTGRFGDTSGGDAAYAWAKSTCNAEGKVLGPNRKFEPGICLRPTGAAGPKPDLVERLASNGEWYLPNGTAPAVKRTPALQFLTRVNQRAAGIGVDTKVCTGCDEQGIGYSSGGRDCESWASPSSDAVFGQVGYTHASNGAQHLAATTDTCEKAYSLYCFEIQ